MNYIKPDMELVERWTSKMLRWGVWGSSGLMILGLVLAALQPSSYLSPTANPTLWGLFLHFLANPLEPSTLMYLGLVCLMLTPIVRVFAALTGFAAEKDWRFVAVSLVVFLMLIGEVIVSSL
ncbi:MAG: DUF1634 domain-containing protein [Bacteroidota bacterium]